MDFPISGVSVSPLLPPLVAFVVSLCTSMGGVSGAFLLLPFQMSVLGYTAPSVSATNQLFNVVAIPSGVLRYMREGRMVWPLTWVVIAGTLPGVLIGAVVRVVWLPDPTWFKAFAGCVLLYIGGRLLRDLIATRAQRGSAAERPRPPHRREGDADVRNATIGVRSIAFDFGDEHFSASTSAIFALSAVVGIVGGIYGIGGGAIVAPFFVSVLGLPVYAVAGAALMGTFVTSVAGVGFYQVLALVWPARSIGPDWLLGILFGLGGMAGMYLGARLQRFVPATSIKWMLAVVILTVALRYLWPAAAAVMSS